MGTATAAEGAACRNSEGEASRPSLQLWLAILVSLLLQRALQSETCKDHAVWVKLKTSSLCPLLQREQPPGTAMAWT